MGFIRSLTDMLSSVRVGFEDLLVPRSDRSLQEYVEVSGVSRPLGGEVIGYADVASSGALSITYIDSSSRSIGFNIARITMVALAVSTGGVVELIPSITNIPEDAPPFIGVKSVEGLLRRIEGLKYIAVRNILGNYYTLEYKDDNIGDELRLTIEDYGLRIASSKRVDAVVVDGPVYHTPQVMFTRYSSLYAKVFEKLLEERIKLLESIGRPVIGFVKRADYSRKLVRCDVIRDLIRKELGRELPEDVTDPLVVELILERIVRPQYMKPVLIGPLILSYHTDRRDLADLLKEKVYWYLGRKTPAGYQVARIEVLKSHWDMYREDVMEVIKHLVGELSMRGVPLGIEVVDRYSRKLTALTYVILYQNLSRILSLAYDEYMKVGEVYNELGVAP